MTGSNSTVLTLFSNTFQGENLSHSGTFSFYRLVSAVLIGIFRSGEWKLPDEYRRDPDLDPVFTFSFSGFLMLVFLPIRITGLILSCMKRRSDEKKLKRIELIEVLLWNVYYASLNGALGEYFTCDVGRSGFSRVNPFPDVDKAVFTLTTIVYLWFFILTIGLNGEKSHSDGFREFAGIYRNHQVLFSGCHSESLFQDHFFIIYFLLRFFMTLFCLCRVYILCIMTPLFIIFLARKIQPFRDPINQKQLEITEGINTVIMVLISLHNGYWSSEKVTGLLVLALHVAQRGVVMFFSYKMMKQERRRQQEERREANNRGSTNSEVQRWNLIMIFIRLLGVGYEQARHPDFFDGGKASSLQTQKDENAARRSKIQKIRYSIAGKEDEEDTEA